MDIDMVNLAVVIQTELQAMMKKGQQLYQSGNMRANVKIVLVDENFIDIFIATDYASYTNTRGKYAGWVEATVDRACRTYASNNNVENADLTGIISY